MRCYLGLGSNLSSPQRQLYYAIKNLRKVPRTSITKISSIYLSRPLGVRSQPIYYNMVIELLTSLSPMMLLKECQSIENKQHRLRKIHWGARTLDLDLLLYENITIKTPLLTIPHPQMLFRDFVITPLLEISPHITMPNGQKIQNLQSNLEVKLKNVINKHT